MDEDTIKMLFIGGSQAHRGFESRFFNTAYMNEDKILIGSNYASGKFNIKKRIKTIEAWVMSE